MSEIRGLYLGMSEKSRTRSVLRCTVGRDQCITIPESRGKGSPARVRGPGLNRPSYTNAPPGRGEANTLDPLRLDPAFRGNPRLPFDPTSLKYFPIRDPAASSSARPRTGRGDWVSPRITNRLRGTATSDGAQGRRRPARHGSLQSEHAARQPWRAPGPRAGPPGGGRPHRPGQSPASPRGPLAPRAGAWWAGVSASGGSELVLEDPPESPGSSVDPPAWGEPGGPPSVASGSPTRPRGGEGGTSMSERDAHLPLRRPRSLRPSLPPAGLPSPAPPPAPPERRRAALRARPSPTPPAMPGTAVGIHHRYGGLGGQSSSRGRRADTPLVRPRDPVWGDIGEIMGRISAESPRETLAAAAPGGV